MGGDGSCKWVMGGGGNEGGGEEEEDMRRQTPLQQFTARAEPNRMVRGTIDCMSLDGCKETTSTCPLVPFLSLDLL